MTAPEERLRAALADRASAARTSPDALDSVFRRVTTHRRRTRAAAGAGLALVLVASAAVATNALRPSTSSLEPGTVPPSRPAPSVPLPTTAAPRPTKAPFTGYPADSAVVVVAGRRVLVVSTTTGAERAEIGRLPADATGLGLAWSPDRSLVYFERSRCRVAVMDRAGTVRDVATGMRPALSPDGHRLATVPCTLNNSQEDPGGGVTVTDLRSRRVTSIRGLSSEPRPDGEQSPPMASAWNAAWFDAHTLAVAVGWEEPEGIVVVNVDRDHDFDHGERLRLGVTDVAALGDTRLGVTMCCMVETEPSEVVRIPWHGATATTLLTFPHAARAVEIDRAGRVLLLSPEGLWRWDRRSAPVLIRRGATAVAG